VLLMTGTQCAAVGEERVLLVKSRLLSVNIRLPAVGRPQQSLEKHPLRMRELEVMLERRAALQTDHSGHWTPEGW